MITTTETLLNSTVYGVPSGNYDGSSLDFFSDPVRAAGYYLGQGSIQTVTLRITGFVGRVKISATLADQPSIQAAWFEVLDFDNPEPNTAVDGRTVTGNFTYLRAEIIGFEQGQIDSITVTY